MWFCFLFSYNSVIDLASILFFCLYIHEINLPELLEGIVGQGSSSNFTEFSFLLFSCSNKKDGSVLYKISWLCSASHFNLGLLLSLSLLFLFCSILLLSAVSLPCGILSQQGALMVSPESSQGLKHSIYFRPCQRLLALTHY